MTEADAALVERCLDGDEVAVRALVERFRSRIFGLCYRMLGHRQDAEDISQDVFLRVFRSLHRWDRKRPLVPWITTIAVNRCRTALKDRTRIPVPTEFIEPPPTNETHDRTELAEELQLALEQLREEYRVCFILFYQQELGCAEISEMLDSPEGTVKTWLHRARRELADILKRRGVVAHDPNELQRV